MPPDPLERLASDLKKLKVEFQRFFNGDLPLPPEELRNHIQKRIRELRNNSNLQGAVESFRLNTLEAQFNTYNELFNRRLRAFEAGQMARPASGGERPYDVKRGVTVGAQVDEDVAAALYDGLRQGSKRVKFDMDRFRSYLDQTVGSLRKKTGCDQVTLRLVSDGDDVKLKAKPVKGGGKED